MFTFNWLEIVHEISKLHETSIFHTLFLVMIDFPVFMELEVLSLSWVPVIGQGSWKPRSVQGQDSFAPLRQTPLPLPS